MQFLSEDEISALRQRLQGCADSPEAPPFDRETLARLLSQAEYAVKAKALLRRFEYFPAEPYTQAGALVEEITSGVNDLWNKYRY